MAIDTTTNLEQPLNPTENEPTTYSQPQIRLFKGQVILNPTISKINFGAYLLHSSYLGAITIPANLLFLPLLNIVYSLTLDERINVTTIVQLTQLAVKLMICPWLGYLCDKYGRRIFIILGIVLQCCSLAVMPHLPGIYPYYVLIQIVYEVGMMCLSAAPLLADYVDYETKGRVAGLGSVISYAASSITTELAANMDVSTGIPSKLHEVAILGLGIGILIILGVKGGNYHKALFYDKKAEDAKQHVPEILEQEAILEEEDYQEQVKKTFGNNRSRISKISKVKVRPDQHHDMEALVENMETNQRAVADTEGLNLNDSVHDNNNPPVVAQQVVEQVARSRQVGRSRLTLVEEFKPGFRAGIREARRNPWVLTGYISGFLSFACVILLNTALINLCTEKIGSDKGPTQAYALTNKHMIVSCITAIIFGFFMDKYNKFKILLFIVTSSIFAVTVLLLSPTVYNWMAYASMVIFGWVCSGYMTITNQLVSKYADPKYRASAIAVLSMCTNLGSAMISILGVYLSKYDIAMPFYIYLGLAVVGLAVLLVIYNKKRNIFDNL